MSGRYVNLDKIGMTKRQRWVLENMLKESGAEVVHYERYQEIGLEKIRFYLSNGWKFSLDDLGLVDFGK